jgi:capsule polysaccharide export protein KpsE/RkpR
MLELTFVPTGTFDEAVAECQNGERLHSSVVVEGPPDEPQRESVLPYLRLFWAHRRALGRTAICALIGSAMIAFLIPVRFRSVTQLMPPDNHSSSGLGLLAAMSGNAGMGALGGLAGDLLGVKSSGELFVGILGSETAQDRVIEQFQLQKVYRAAKIEDARKELAAHTDLLVDRKSGIISIAVTDHDPKRAAAMAHAYVDELDLLVVQLSTSEARRERIFLEQQIQKVKAELDAAEKNFSDFASRNSAIDIPAQGKAMVQAAASLQGELIAGQAELSGLQQIYSNNNARVRASQARVNELQKKLNEISGQDESGDSKGDNSLYPSLRKLPVLGLTYADLYRQTKIEETVYELLTQQYEMAKVEEAKEIPSVKVLDSAMVPTKKSFPPRTLITLLGCMLALSANMAWIIGKVRWGAVDANDPRKVFATEVFTTMKARVQHLSGNGAHNGSNGHHPERLDPSFVEGKDSDT